MNGAICIGWDMGAGDDATVVVRLIPGEDMAVVGSWFDKDPRVIEGEFERIEPPSLPGSNGHG